MGTWSRSIGRPLGSIQQDIVPYKQVARHSLVQLYTPIFFFGVSLRTARFCTLGGDEAPTSSWGSDEAPTSSCGSDEVPTSSRGAMK
jgi:hypothetical protein